QRPFTPSRSRDRSAAATKPRRATPAICVAGSANSPPPLRPAPSRHRRPVTSTSGQSRPRADPAGVPPNRMSRRTSPTPARACSGPPGHTTLALTRRTTTVDTLEDTTANVTKDNSAKDSAATDPTQATQWMQLPLRAFLLGPDLPLAVTLTP